MNIPDGWLAAIGAAFVAAVTFIANFAKKHLDRYIDDMREEVAELKEGQKECDRTSLDLTDRVARLEGERDGFLGGVDYTTSKFRREVVDEIVERLEQKD